MPQTVTRAGKPVSVSGRYPQTGDDARAFTLVGKDLAAVALADFTGRRKVIQIFPGIDAPTCAMSVRRLDTRANALPDAVVPSISADLPFVRARLGGAGGLDNVVTLSTLRGGAFLGDRGARITSGEVAGLAARAVVTVDEAAHGPLVCEIETGPAYDAALAAP